MLTYIINNISNYYSGVGSIFIFWEFMAFLTGVIYVLLARKQKVSCYIYGIASTLIYIYLSYNNKIYGYMLINTYYFFMSIYGWYLWKLMSKDVLKITNMFYKDYLKVLVLFCLSFAVVFGFISYFNDSDVIYLDSFFTSLSFCAMWLMVRKKIENWIFWIFVNLMWTMLFIYKGIFITTFLHTIYLILSFSGYLEWKKNLNKLEKI